MRVNSQGYQQVIVDIYVPKDLQNKPVFRPSRYIAVPSIGQRLAISADSVDLVDVFESTYRKFGYRSPLSDRERVFARENPYDAVVGYYCRTLAEGITKIKFWRSTGDDESDAFRHFMWAGLLTKHLGEKKAEEILTAHEDRPDDPQASKEMDLHNNKVGMEAANKLIERNHFSIWSLKEEAENALRDEKLVILERRGGRYGH
jgi:hypothetical protein